MSTAHVRMSADGEVVVTFLDDDGQPFDPNTMLDVEPMRAVRSSANVEHVRSSKYDDDKRRRPDPKRSSGAKRRTRHLRTMRAQKNVAA